MTGHFVARSVRTEREEKRGEEALDSERKVEVLVLPRKGQEFLKRAILSIGGRRSNKFSTSYRLFNNWASNQSQLGY